MPPVFKALASITAWTFFIVAWVIALSNLIMGIINGYLFGAAPPPLTVSAGFVIALGYGLAAVVVMILRQKME